MRSARPTLHQNVVSAFRLRSIKSPAHLPGLLQLPMLTLILSLPRSAHGEARHSSHTGWPMDGRSRIGKLVSRSSLHSGAVVCVQSLMLYSASSMIASGLNWRLAIGALVLGNSIMGAVITINGRIGARVSTRRCHATIRMVQLTLPSSTLRSQSSLVCHSDTTLVTSL
jgi:hypothetical protein